MTSKPLPGRRTRSQIELSDDILRVPEHSPMKAARNAVRNSEPPSDMNSMAESEDELLLSPNKKTNLQRSKRSVSPPREDGYSSRISEEGNGREFKRMKWDLGGEGVKNPARARLANAGHARTNSEPNAGPSREAPRKRAGTASSNNKPSSMSQVPASPTVQSPTGVPGKTRARSVPLFPSQLSRPLPHLDLRNPPLSPTRARSPCSSDKYHGLKVYPSPARTSALEQRPLQVEAFSDNPKVPMEVDEECPVPPVFDTDTTVEGSGIGMTAPPEVSIRRPESPSVQAPTTTTPVDHSIVPATPMPSEPTLVISMSPLTPLPLTPLPTESAAGEGGGRYNTNDSWGFDLGKGPGGESPLKPIAQPDFGNPKNAVTTPSAIDTAPGSQISQPPLPSPPLPTPAAPILVNAEKAKPTSLRVAPHRSLGSSSGLNAFSLLMQNATKQHTNKSQDKGKGKAVSLLPKNSTTGAINTKGKGKLESEVKKPSFKDRMRRKEKQKPAAPAKFVPMIFDEDEEEQVEPKGQELEAKTPLVLEPVMPELEEKPSLLEDITQEGSREPLPVVPDELPAVEPSTARELEAEPLPENKVSPERVPQPPSPVASLPETEPDLPERPTGLEEFVPFTPAISEVPVVQEQHRCATSLLQPIARDDVIQAEANIPTAVDVPTEPQATEEPLLAPQATDIPVEQPVQPSKLKSAPRKRGQSNIPTSTRITRSTLRPPVPPVVKPTAARRGTQVAVPTRRNSISAPSGAKSGASSEAEVQQLPMGSPMQTSSPLQTPSRKFRTPGSSPAKISLAKTPSKPVFTDGSPSPTKIARAVSMFSRPSGVFATDDIQVNQGGSSLSTLSNALEKLKMPAPSRPNTSLGFNHAASEDDNNEDPPVLAQSTGPDQGGSSLQRNTSRRRSFSIGHGAPGESSKTSVPFGSLPTSKAGPSTTKPQLVQKSMTSFFSKPNSSSMSISNPRSVKSQLLGHSKFTLNGVGAKGNNKVPFSIAGLSGGGKLYPMANKRLVQKVSKKTTLPMVEASPIKGGSGVGEAADDNIIVDGFMTGVTGTAEKSVTSEGLGDVFMVPFAKGDDDGTQVIEVSGSGEKRKNKGKEREKDEDKSGKKDSSRRASLALSQLSQSLSAAPAYGMGDKERMGPPATPRKIARSVSSTYPAPSNATATSNATTTATVTATTNSAASSKSTSPDKIPTPTGTRSSARQAAKAAVNADSSSPVSSTDPGGSGKKIKGASVPENKAESLKILSNCVIFVDVRTDDGEEAGSLFIEMLEGLGAKILARVGQTCTHVIFKNGLMSTISRWRLLRDPKPSVVGIAWVVDCVEQRRHVEEAPYLINLKEINVAGTNKRRRSMLPKLISRGMTESTATDVEGEEGEADVSMESTSSVTLDDDLTPLERARRRRSMIFGPPA